MHKLMKAVISLIMASFTIVFIKYYNKSLKSMENTEIQDISFNTILNSALKTLKSDNKGPIKVKTPTKATTIDLVNNVHTPPSVKNHGLPVLGYKSSSFATKEDFNSMMGQRIMVLKQVCNNTSEARRKFNFRTFYVLQVRGKTNIPTL